MNRKKSEMKNEILANCHDGTGKLICTSVLTGADIKGITFMHDDLIEPGATIGEHPHDEHEEIYYVVEGHGWIILDGKKSPIGSGDISIVHIGHSHGIINSPDKTMRLIVIGVKA